MPDTETSYAKILTNVSHELQALGATARDLEHAVLVDPLGASDLQSFDLLIQTIDELAGFVANLSGAMPRGNLLPVNEAFSRIRLEALKERLSGATPQRISDRTVLF